MISVKFHIFSLIRHIFNQNSLKMMCTMYEKHKRIMNIVGLMYFYHKDAMRHL